MKHIIATILLITTLLTAQLGNWSPPVQLSIDGVHPYNMIGIPAITVDNNGTIHAFWVKSIEEDGGALPWEWYSQIEYRRSADGGKTWDATENLTPDYFEHRINYMKAVCDSKNNVHLVYMRGSEGYEILYKKFDGTTWSAPELIGYGSSYLRMNIDSVDRIYATWMIGREAYFAYYDNGVWSDYKQIGSGEYGLDDLKFDQNNLLYAVGSCWTDLTPYLFIYDKMVENWIKIEEMPNDTLEFGAANVVSRDNDELFINISYRTYANSKDFHMTMEMNTGEYSFPYEYGDKNNPEREMYMDKYNYIHLFEKHYYDSDYVTMGLIHNIGKNEIWETTAIDSSSYHTYSEPNVAFDKVNNKFFLLYQKYEIDNMIMYINFRSKQNTTGIEDNDSHSVVDFRLNQNYPNPFNNQTNISYGLSQTCEVELSVFNPKGQIVAVLVNSKQSKGNHSIQFNADNLNSGVYYYQLKTDGILRSLKRMVYLK
ncbi:MAG TPA: T9SS type A sorting domain-containing protein [Clostridiales bacterium]|nr:T9SS type A sorting domain-containing protein [Clostridiales bacterium]